jgi:ribosome maturation factor RimP
VNTVPDATLLVFRDGKEDKVLGFALEEVRDCRLVPVVDFKGRKARAPAPATGDGAAPSQESGGQEE